MMAAPLSLFAVWALLLLPLVISPILGLLTPYATLLVITPLFVVALVRRQFATAYSDHAARAFLAVFVVLALVFVVTADDDSTPIEITYSAFRPGEDPEVRTTTAVGPAVSLLQSNCGNQAASAPWTFTAASATGGSLACAVFYGGKLVKSTSDYAEGDVARGTAVDCTSHPGM